MTLERGLRVCAASSRATDEDDVAILRDFVPPRFDIPKRNEECPPDARLFPFVRLANVDEQGTRIQALARILGVYDFG